MRNVSAFLPAKYIYAALLCLISLAGIAQPNIVKVEYYIDTDPGIGAATNLPVTAAADIADQALNINTTPLSIGIHTLGIRALDANGNWSHTNKWLFVKPFPSLATGAPTNITAVEYYLDTDPGIGAATLIGSLPASTDLSNMALNLNITGLAAGIHTFGIRAKDANGNWSHTNKWLFVKPFSSLYTGPATNITSVEYYLDADPGIGVATQVGSLPSATDLSDITVNLDISVLTTGIHIFGIRAKDANGTWSHTNKWLFVKPYPSLGPGALPNITKVEYFVDIDPGLGLATPYSFTPGTSLPDSTLLLSLTGISGGPHKFHIRALDANGSWSHTNTFDFNLDLSGDICPNGTASYTSNVTGSTYQWQVNPGTGFTNLSDGTNYSGTATATITLINIPSAWYGYQYRCLVNGSSYSSVTTLRIVDYWVGGISTAWENTANWSCNVLPDANTDVIINLGTPVLSSTTSIRSLTHQLGAQLTINSGFKLTLLH